MLRRKEMAGFTLVELMLVVVLLGIFAAIALPGFTTLVNSNKVEAASNELSNLLQYARSEAVNRGDSVTLTLTGTDWLNGAISVTTSGGAVLRSYDATGFNLPGMAATSSATGNQVLTFRGSGTLSGGAVNFTVCYSGNNKPPGKRVNVAATGQVTITNNIGC